MAAFVARMLSERAREFKPRLIPDDLRFGLRFAVRHLEEAAPRILNPKSDDKPIIVFTDGACEDVTTISGVMFVPGEPPQAFGCELREGDIAAWKSKL